MNISDESFGAHGAVSRRANGRRRAKDSKRELPFIVQTRRRRHRDTQPRALDVDQHVATTTTRNMNANSEGGISLCVEGFIRRGFELACLQGHYS